VVLKKSKKDPLFIYQLHTLQPNCMHALIFDLFLNYKIKLLSLPLNVMKNK